MMAALTIKDIPEEIARRYKAVCAIKGTSMREEIIEYMRKEIELCDQLSHSKQKGGDVGKH